MFIGKPKRVFTVEPLRDVVPQQEQAQPVEKQETKQPAPVPSAPR
jgi:hypothetical protein